MFRRRPTHVDVPRTKATIVQLSAGLIGAGLLALPACARHPAKTAAKAAVPPPKPVAKAKPAPAARTIEPVPNTPEQRLGTVRVVGAHGSFVLIETPSASLTAAVPVGYLLHCRPVGVSSGMSSADLRVSPERRQPFVVADVISGTPSIGDVAYLAKEGAAPVTPPVSMPSIPFSSVLPAAAPPPTPTPAANP